MRFFEKIRGIFSTAKSPEAHAGTGSDAVLLEKVAAYKRKTWMPLVEEEGEDEALASKIGGAAYLMPGEQYPSCTHCGEPLTFFLQLNPQTLPENCDLDLEPDQLIQLFYCTNQQPHCELACEAWQPFAKSELARSIPLPTNDVALPAIKLPRQFPLSLIVDWVENDDYPDWQEMQLGAAQLSEQEVEQLETTDIAAPKAADKLGGWPYWVQGVEYPACTECGLQMQMIFQLDSRHHLPYTFGDAGIAHLHQCRLHKNILAFSWASY